MDILYVLFFFHRRCIKRKIKNKNAQLYYSENFIKPRTQFIKSHRNIVSRYGSESIVLFSSSWLLSETRKKNNAVVDNRKIFLCSHTMWCGCIIFKLEKNVIAEITWSSQCDAYSIYMNFFFFFVSKTKNTEIAVINVFLVFHPRKHPRLIISPCR